MQPVFPALLFVLTLMADTSDAQEITTVTTDCYTKPQIESNVNGKPQDPGIDLLCADIPEELTNQVTRLTGIVAKDNRISMIVVDLGDGRWMHHVGGNGFSFKSSGELPSSGIKPWNRDFSIRHISLVESVSDNKLYAYGYFDFNDKLKETRCVIAVEIRGEIIIQEGNKPKLQGTATWTGPFQNVRFPAMEKKEQVDRGTKQ